MKDDLAFVPADAIVRPATVALEPTLPSLRRLEHLGGPAFWQQMQVKQELEVGAAVVTAAGNLDVEFVIHAVIMGRDTPVSASGVRRALLSVLQRAADWQLGRVALPPLGTGAGNLSTEDAARIMIDVLQSTMRSAPYPREACIVVDTDDEREIFETVLKSVTEP